MKAILQLRKLLAKEQHSFDASTINRAMEICLMRKEMADILKRELTFAHENNPYLQQYMLLAEQGIFSRTSIEQGTHPIIALHHAKRFEGFKSVLEICTGSGFDTAALAMYAEQVTTIEADEETAQSARHNLHVMGLNNVEVIHGTAEGVLESQYKHGSWQGLWSDPSRRVTSGQNKGERASHPEEYTPKLSFLYSQQTLLITHLIGVKISPAHDVEYLTENYKAASWTHEWVGFERECREHILWCKTSKNESLKNKQSLTSTFVSFPRLQIAYPQEVAQNAFRDETPTDTLQQDISLPVIPTSKHYSHLQGMHLVEPHKVLVRSGCMTHLFAEHHITLFDSNIAYGISKHPPTLSPLLTAFYINAVIPYSKKAIQKMISQLGCTNATEIKKRGFPLDAHAIRNQFRFVKKKGKEKEKKHVIIITRKGNDHYAFFTERM
jgi:hypothetical protein